MDSFVEDFCYDDEEVPVEPKLIFDPVSLVFLPILMLLFVLLLGFIKALLGLCIHPIGKWGYNYMQPFHKYERSSKCRQFRMNLIFFFIVPCLYCCTTCCGIIAWKDISHLDNTSDQLEKGHHLKKQFILKREKYEVYDDDDDEDDSPIGSSESNESNGVVPCETTNLLFPSKYNYPKTMKKKKTKKEVENDRIDNNNNNRQVTDVAPQNKDEDNNNNSHHSSSKDRIRQSAGHSMLHDSKTDSNNEEEKETEDTSFILSALTESRDSMRCLDGPLHNNDNDDDNNYSQDVNDYIKTLFGTQMVYRVFDHPIGDILVEPGEKYSIRGFFIPSLGNKYKFITNLPLRQHWRINKPTQSLVPLFPPIVLLSRDFTRVYENKQDVFDSNDLITKPIITAPVLNMQLQANYIYDDDNKQFCDTTSNNQN